MSRMPWFRVDTDLVDHPKVDRLADLLNEPLAGWYVMRMWAWVARFASRGRLSDVARPSLERSCGWRGESGQLVAALVEAGLLDTIEADEDGCTLEVHDWWEKQGAIVSKAENDRERLRKQRADRGSKKPAVEPSSSERRETVARASSERRGSVAGDVTGRDVTLKEEPASPPASQPSLELVGEKSPKPKTPKPPDPQAELERFAKALTVDEGKVFEAYETAAGVELGADWGLRKLVGQKLRAHTADELCAAIRGYLADPWKRENSPSLRAILRDASVIAINAKKARGAA